MATSKNLKIRPYARLLTMLGEQLIKNERIALMELIKNSYDADASWAKISFLNFDDGYKIKQDSKIVIEDNGHGMSPDIIERHWLNPATPEKKLRKVKKDTTKKGRVIQGEKGIGRFSILKLGKKINIITRAENENQESKIQYDFSIYDNDFLSENGEAKELFIDDLTVSLSIRSPQYFRANREINLGTRRINAPSHGTVIEITDLKGSWSTNKVQKVYSDLARLQSIFVGCIDANKSDNNAFEVLIYKDNDNEAFEEKYFEKLHLLLNEYTVIKLENGIFDGDHTISFHINDKPSKIDIFDPKFTGLRPFKDIFGNGAKELRERKLECGSFKFGFYIFDLSPKAPNRYKLDKEDKKILRSHRIYLYRDGIRVYPYGDEEDDWLSIDIMRGTISAGQFLSNDQIVGYVNISQKDNPRLQDKTNREGLIDEGNATQDFITILQNLLAFLRAYPFKKYQVTEQKKKEQDNIGTKQIDKNFEELKNSVIENKKALGLIKKVEQGFKTERQYLMRRVDTTEELAGVGLSVETASHDIKAIMARVLANIDGLISDLMTGGGIDREGLLKELQSVRGGMSFVDAQLKDIQLLFKSSKQRRKNIRIIEIVKKVERIYKRLLNKEAISLKINTVGSPLIAKTTDAVLLQLILNLMDNSVYWLQQISKKDKRIEVLLDGDKGQMIFSDNGPGIDNEDASYVFEPFFSGKGDEGRGLGLYIARQLLERHEYSIELAELKSDKILSGANFIINFVVEEK